MKEIYVRLTLAELKRLLGASYEDAGDGEQYWQLDPAILKKFSRARRRLETGLEWIA